MQYAFNQQKTTEGAAAVQFVQFENPDAAIHFQWSSSDPEAFDTLAAHARGAAAWLRSQQPPAPAPTAAAPIPTPPTAPAYRGPYDDPQPPSTPAEVPVAGQTGDTANV